MPGADAAKAEPDRVSLGIRITPQLRRRLKIAAATEGRDVQAVVITAVETYLTQHGL